MKNRIRFLELALTFSLFTACSNEEATTNTPSIAPYAHLQLRFHVNDSLHDFSPTTNEEANEPVIHLQQFNEWQHRLSLVAHHPNDTIQHLRFTVEFEDEFHLPLDLRVNRTAHLTTCQIQYQNAAGERYTTPPLPMQANDTLTGLRIHFMDEDLMIGEFNATLLAENDTLPDLQLHSGTFELRYIQH